MRPHLIAALAAAVLIAGCSDDPEGAGPAVGTDPDASASAEAGARAGAGGVGDISSMEYFEAVIGDRVFFATDSFALDAEAQRVLAQQADWLQRNPGTTVTVEGHADERGTREYNLALGARRANAARSFLVGEGVAGNRIDTVSYGKERPEALCSNESCWSQNRRAVSRVQAAPGS
jgi:peptidoglycan-associated lipoprotein